MASPGQVEFIEDLMERQGVTRDDLADLDEVEGADNYEDLPAAAASELIDLLRDPDRWRR
jgi:hypothetical protein